MMRSLITLFLCLCSAPCVLAASDKPPPIGYAIFCMRLPSECKPAASTHIENTPSNWSLINKVNRSVNGAIHSVADETETWSVNVSSGDCEDFALTKRNRLIRAGIPAGALRMADVTTGQGLRHAVLIVKTASGDYVLDNLRSSIVKRQHSGYRFNSVASANPLKWETD